MDSIKVKILQDVIVQENGIIRTKEGALIGRLSDYSYDDLKGTEKPNDDFHFEAERIVDGIRERYEGDTNIIRHIINPLVGWMTTAAQYAGNAEYYRKLLEECGEIIGIEARTADDGSVLDRVLCSTIPKLVKEKYDGRT